MIRAVSISPGGDRSRLRGWLLRSLAGLCELQLLRERQELRVRRALRACCESTEHDDEKASLEAAEQMDSLPELMWELEQQVQSLRLEGSGTCGDMAETNGWPSFGFHEPTSPGVPPDSPASFCGNGFPSFHCVPESYPRVDHSEARMLYANERPKSVGDLGISGASLCRGGREMVHRSFSAPYSRSQDYIADLHTKYQSDYQSQKMDPFVFPSPLHAVSLQNPNICQSPFQSCYYEDALYSDYSGKSTANIDIYETSPDGHQPFPETAQWQKVENYMLSLIHRRGLIVRASNPQTTLNAEPEKVVIRQNSMCKRPSELDRKSHPSPAASPCGYDSNAVTNRVWPPWNCGVEGERSQAVNICQPHSSLRKPPKLHVALTHPRSLSMDHYEYNYSPVSTSHYPNDLTFDASPNEVSSDSPTLVYPPGSPCHEACDTVFTLPLCEKDDDFKKHPAPAKESGCQMVNAQYIPGQVEIRPQPSHRPVKKKPPPISKVQSVELSLDRCPAAMTRSTASKKCWFPEEALNIRKYGAKKMSPHIKKTPRSQSENSLVNIQASIDRTITKYHTVDREEVALNKGSRQCCPPVIAHRKWRSTAEICQDELNSSDLYRGPKRSKKFTKVAAAVSASTGIGFHMLYGYTGSESEYTFKQLQVNKSPVCEPEEDMSAYNGNCFGESESILSEADSPGSRDTDDSESDETGGMVWPQQLSPRVISSTGAGNSGGQPKVFVKIKASHALKKKILRFRTGSLKVMTTV